MLYHGPYNSTKCFYVAQVTIFVGATQSYAANDSNVRVYNDDKIAALFRNPHGSASRDFKTMPDIEQLRYLLMYQSCYCDDLLGNEEAMEEIRHADLVIGEILYFCSALVADKFDLPHVIIAATSLSTPTGIVFGLPSPLSYVPQWGASLTQEFTFVDRVQNVLQWMLLYVFYIHEICPMYNELKVKYGITPSKDIHQTLGRLDLVLGQMDFTLGHPRPLLPSKYPSFKINCMLSQIFQDCKMMFLTLFVAWCLWSISKFTYSFIYLFFYLLISITQMINKKRKT